MVVAPHHMFRFGPGALGVHAYGRASEQGTSPKRAVTNQRASRKSVARDAASDESR